MPDIPRPQLAEDGRDAARPRARNEASRERAIVALLSERSLGAAARKACVGERTIRRWIAEDTEFQTELATARRASFQAGVERVQTLMGQAVGVLEDLLAEKKHPAVRLGAARMVIELALNRNDVEALLTRIEELERVQREAEA